MAADWKLIVVAESAGLCAQASGRLWNLQDCSGDATQCRIVANYAARAIGEL
jgi:hypothetical protein